MCPSRAAHGALRVRLVQVTPAADAREPGRWHRTQPRTRGRNARRGSSYKYRKSPLCDGRTRTAPGRARTFATHTRRTHTRAKVQSAENARTHAHALTKPRAHRRTRVRTHKHPLHTQMHTHTQPCTHTRSLHANARARAHTSYGPLEDPVPLKNAVRTTPVPRRHRFGTASAPRRYRARALPRTR